MLDTGLPHMQAPPIAFSEIVSMARPYSPSTKVGVEPIRTLYDHELKIGGELQHTGGPRRSKRTKGSLLSCDAFPDAPGIVTVTEPHEFLADDAATVTATICVNGDEHPIRYSVSRKSSSVTSDIVPLKLSTRSDVFVPLALLVALRLGRPLQLSGPVSARLLAQIPRIEDVWHTWRNFPRVAVTARSETLTVVNSSRGVACFFSGGIDSYYTFLKHRDEITHLILVSGFDIHLDDRSLHDKVASELRHAAGEFGKQLLEVRTNARQCCDKFYPWDEANGAALASVALLLSPILRKVYIAGTGTYATLLPSGTHPMLDPLWSTEETEIVSDGYEAARFEKCKEIVRCKTAVRTLRVCWTNSNGAYNCGKCFKCLQAMAMLRALGALNAAPTFDIDLNLRALARECAPSYNAGPMGPLFQRSVYLMLEHVERDGRDSALAGALRDCIRDRYHRGVWLLLNLIVRVVRRLCRIVTARR